MPVSLIKFMSFSTAEQYPKLVNGPPPERRRVGKDKNQICDKRERARKGVVTKKGNNKQRFAQAIPKQSQHFFFHSPNATMKIFV